MSEDIFDIVNSRDEVVSSAPRSQVHSTGALHRSVHILMFCGEGADRKILLQMRSPYKDRYPSRLTAPCSGHVDSGETYETAAIRETREETGVRVPISDLREVGKIAPCADTENEFARVWTLELSGAESFSFDPGEVSYLKWVPVSDFERELAERPENFTPAFRLVYRFYLSKQAT